MNAKNAIKALKAIGDGVRFGDVRMARYETLSGCINELTLIAKGGATQKDLKDVEKAVRFGRFELIEADGCANLWAIIGKTESGARFETADPEADYVTTYGPNDEPMANKVRITVTR